MKGLLLKDLYYLKSMKNALIVFMGLWILNFMTRSNYFASLLMISYINGVMSIQTIYEEEKSNWNKYSLTMPINKSEIVMSKYLLTFFTIIVSILIGIICLMLFNNFSININTLSTVAMVIGLNLMFFSLYMLIAIKYGMEKSTIMLFVFIGVMVLTILYLYNKLPLVKEMFQNIFYRFNSINEVGTIFLSIGIGLFLYILSMLVSIKIFKNKEF
ncbi:ABC-2 transporter permease [Miniphocaeibacter halophilus]|uniref:ABC-2 transporter permease n=1 Tax=Miniphocaeibacter halophilus TaxID=2931922 RepID=A0AC61MS80_9FIRM|nr:ABC-2 transporter permease [Miniphocaeibacter halophilus]QQK08499.1 ABC-2 transporter permease [Miniphocaeibacter halophilus]